MNRRKIQKTGIATYTLSLPKSWIIRNNIKKGVSVIIEEEADQCLRIIPYEKEETVTEAIIDLNEFNNELEIIRKFTSYYISGASKIIIRSDTTISTEYLKTITSQIKKVIGFEIIEETKTKIVLQDFFTSNYLSIRNSIRREFNLSKLMLEESLKTLTKEVDNLDNIKAWEDEVNKLYLLVRRQINFALHNSVTLKQLEISITDCQDYLLLIGVIEKMADSFVKIAILGASIDSVQEKIIKKINKIYEKTTQAYEMAFNSIFRDDFKLANEAILKCDELSQIRISPEFSGVIEKDKLHLYTILSSLREKSNMIREMAEIGLDRH